MFHKAFLSTVPHVNAYVVPVACLMTNAMYVLVDNSACLLCTPPIFSSHTFLHLFPRSSNCSNCWRGLTPRDVFGKPPLASMKSPVSITSSYWRVLLIDRRYKYGCYKLIPLMREVQHLFWSEQILLWIYVKIQIYEPILLLHSIFHSIINIFKLNHLSVYGKYIQCFV